MTKPTYLEKRFIPEGSQELRADDVKIVVYISTEAVNGLPIAIAYSGKRTKHDFYSRFKNTEEMDARIETYVSRARENLVKEAEWKEEKKAKAKEFKASIKVGTYLRTSFSYNMTFNYAFLVTAIKGNKVTVQELETEWISGDKGWTGNVAITNRALNKEPFEVRFSVNGLKINNNYATLVQLGDEFYENHCD